VNATATLEAIQALPLEDRLEVLFRAWDGLVDDGWQPAFDNELKVELDRRWANYQANPDSGLTWEQVVAHVRNAQ
jgi:putative addiction module component (TIGR02574 family)